MVSRGNLLVSSESRIPASRVEALIQHEVGTHVLTYHNGRAQPLRQLYTGLAGYDALQEGLAVLAEYLVGGLSRPRLRLLAARVVAAAHMIDGATFVETFRELDRTHGFSQRTAFVVTMRTYRGGGLTKDAVYLRGLRQILDYLGNGGRLRAAVRRQDRRPAHSRRPRAAVAGGAQGAAADAKLHGLSARRSSGSSGLRGRSVGRRSDAKGERR